MVDTLMNIIWASQYILLLVIIFCIGCILLLYRYNQQNKCLRLLVHSDHEKKLVRNFSLRKKKIQTSILSLGLLFLVLAIARPQWHMQEQQLAQEGRDILIALDISRSMLAQDVQPNRLEFAKLKIKKLITDGKLSTDRVGLLIFAGDAFLLCPLTTDISAFNLFLDSINHETLSSSSTALDKACTKALDIFSKMVGRKSKLLVIVTDGEDFSSDLTHIKDKMCQLGIHAFTLGIGTEQGAPIPLTNKQGITQDYQKDTAGNIVISRLNAQILQKIAHDTGGWYVPATSDSTDITRILKKIQVFEKEKYDDKKVKLLEEQYIYFAGASLVCFILEWVL
jgi:Ca-activated chloride channel homolog